MGKDGNRRGQLWSKLKADDAVKPLTAILTLNTIAHTMGAAGVGSEVQNQFGNEYLTIASVILHWPYCSCLKLFQRRWGQPIGASYLLQLDLFSTLSQSHCFSSLHQFSG